MKTVGSKSKAAVADKFGEDAQSSERKYLQSNRFDVSEFDVPETSWDFYDAFNSSGPTQIALRNHETSTDGDNLNKYLRKSAHAFYNSTPVSIAAAKNAPPPKIQKLLDMQEPNGKWLNLGKVLHCLGLPAFLQLDECVTTCEWEPATAFAVAAMRQNIDFVAQLEKAHNKGVLWLPSSKIIKHARELINEFKDFDPDELIDEADGYHDSDFNHVVNYNSKSADFNEDDYNIDDDDDLDSSCGSIQHQKQLAPDLQSYFAKSNWNEIEKLWRPDIKIASREYLYSTMSSPVANRKYTSLKPLSGRPAASSWTLGSASASCDDASAAFNILTVMNSVSSGSDQLNGDGDVKSHNFPRNISSFCTGSSIGSASNAFHDRIDNYDLSYKHTPNPKDNMKEYAELEGISLADFHIHNNHTRKSRLASRQGSAIGTAIHHRRAQLEPQTQLAPVSSIACSIQSATDINGSSEQDYNLQIVNPNDTPNLLLDHSLTIQTSMTSSPGASKRAERDAFIRSSQSGFQKILSTMLPQFDKVLFNRLESELDSKQIKIMMMCMELEDHLQILINCKDKSVYLFNKSITTAERNVQFSELTARLGSGAAPREGFLDWRKDGVPGIRNSCLDILNEVFEMAELRLRRLEILAPPEGQQAIHDEKMKNNRDILFIDYQLLPLDRWELVYNGSDVVYKVLHILDDFRKCRELADWFGRRFYFLGNPLMLPFDLFSTMEALKLGGKVDYHMQRLKSSDDETLDWQFEKYMNSFRDSFHKICTENWFPSWPLAPNISHDDDNRRLYRALLVLFIRCGPSVQKTMEYEKKFIFVAGTLRGKNLMEGENGAKIERALNIPIGRLKFLNSIGDDPNNKSVEQEAVDPPKNNCSVDKKWGLDRFPKKKVPKVVVVRGLKRHEKKTAEAHIKNTGPNTESKKLLMESVVKESENSEKLVESLNSNDEKDADTVDYTLPIDDENSIDATQQPPKQDETGNNEESQVQGNEIKVDNFPTTATVASTTDPSIGNLNTLIPIESSKYRATKLAKEIFGQDKPLPSKQALASEAGTSRKVARLPAMNLSDSTPKMTRRVKK